MPCLILLVESCGKCAAILLSCRSIVNSPWEASVSSFHVCHCDWITKPEMIEKISEIAEKSQGIELRFAESVLLGSKLKSRIEKKRMVNKKIKTVIFKATVRIAF